MDRLISEKSVMEVIYGCDWFIDEEHAEVIKERINAIPSAEPSGDSISRQAAIASIKNLYPDMPIMDIFEARRKWLEKYAPYFECENAVEQLPSVNPQPKTGHWKAKSFHEIFCDNCGFDFDIMRNDFIDKMNYCPNCGCRMVKPQEREDEA